MSRSLNEIHFVFMMKQPFTYETKLSMDKVLKDSFILGFLWHVHYAMTGEMFSFVNICIDMFVNFQFSNLMEMLT